MMNVQDVPSAAVWLLALASLVACDTKTSVVVESSPQATPANQAASAVGGASSPTATASPQESAAPKVAPKPKRPKPRKLTKLLWSPKGEPGQRLADVGEVFAGLHDAERAAAGYVSTLLGSGCDWVREPKHMADGEFIKGVMRCPLTSALKLGRQCSDGHKQFMTTWLADDLPSHCYAKPITAFARSILREVTLVTNSAGIVVNYQAVQTEGPGGRTWSWSEELRFGFVKNTQLKLVKRRVTKGKRP